MDSLYKLYHFGSSWGVSCLFLCKKSTIHTHLGIQWKIKSNVHHPKGLKPRAALFLADGVYHSSWCWHPDGIRSRRVVKLTSIVRIHGEQRAFHHHRAPYAACYCASSVSDFQHRRQWEGVRRCHNKLRPCWNKVNNVSFSFLTINKMIPNCQLAENTTLVIFDNWFTYKKLFSTDGWSTTYSVDFR